MSNTIDWVREPTAVQGMDDVTFEIGVDVDPTSDDTSATLYIFGEEESTVSPASSNVEYWSGNVTWDTSELLPGTYEYTVEEDTSGDTRSGTIQVHASRILVYNGNKWKRPDGIQVGATTELWDHGPQISSNDVVFVDEYYDSTWSDYDVMDGFVLGDGTDGPYFDIVQSDSSFMNGSVITPSTDHNSGGYYSSSGLNYYPSEHDKIVYYQRIQETGISSISPIFGISESDHGFRCYLNASREVFCVEHIDVNEGDTETLASSSIGYTGDPPWASETPLLLRHEIDWVEDGVIWYRVYADTDDTVGLQLADSMVATTNHSYGDGVGFSYVAGKNYGESGFGVVEQSKVQVAPNMALCKWSEDSRLE